jgi:hypothetical protein
MNPTMEQLDAMGPQAVFNFVAAHLLSQRRRAVNHEGQCQYRARDGSMCAVGCLIPGAYCHPAMEGHYVSDLAADLHSMMFGWRLGRFLLRHAALVDELQRVHDRSEPPTWRRQLVKVALRYGLDPSVAEYNDLRVVSPPALIRVDNLKFGLLLAPREVRNVVSLCEETREVAAA